MISTIIFYNAILLLSTAFIYLSEKGNTPIGRAVCTIIAFLIVFLPSALRYEIGVDYLSYRDIYTEIGLGYNSYVEPGYFYLNYFFNKLNLQVEYFFAFIAFFIYFFAFLSYPKRYKTLFHYFYITVFYFSTFNTLRSMMVTSLILLAIMQYRRNKNNLIFFSLILFACFFHKTAILIGFLPFFYNKISTILLKKNSIFIVLSLICIFLFKDYILYWLMNSGAMELLGYHSYINNPLWMNSTELGSGLGVLIKVLILLFVILFIRKILSFNQKNIILILIILACLISLIFSISIKIIYRIEKLYSVAYIFAPLLIISTPKIPLKRTFIICSIFFWLAIFNMSIIKGSTNHLQTCSGEKISPYISILNKQSNMRHPDNKHESHCKLLISK